MRRRGYTLLELLVVMAIFAIGFGFVAVSFRHVNESHNFELTTTSFITRLQEMQSWSQANRLPNPADWQDPQKRVVVYGVLLSPLTWGWVQVGDTGLYPDNIEKYFSAPYRNYGRVAKSRYFFDDPAHQADNVTTFAGIGFRIPSGDALITSSGIFSGGLNLSPGPLFVYFANDTLRRCRKVTVQGRQFTQKEVAPSECGY